VTVCFENGHELYGFVRRGDFLSLLIVGSADSSRRVVLHRIGEFVKTEDLRKHWLLLIRKWSYYLFSCLISIFVVVK